MISNKTVLLTQGILS